MYKKIFCSQGKKLSVLIDPDKHDDESLAKLVRISTKARVDFFLIGGSLLFTPIDEAIRKIKQYTDIPLILFPGNLTQVSKSVDAMLFLSLISGRNPEMLIGNHVVAAPLIKKLNVETISTGYVLIQSGKTTSVEYMSNTQPIPANKIDIATATALAGEMLGLKLIYLEAGSGAQNHVPLDVIKSVKSNLSTPLIVGGGIRSKEQLNQVFIAGADIVVVGNLFEEKVDLVNEFVHIAKTFSD